MAFKMKGSAFYGKGNQSPSAFLKETNQPPEGRTSTKESNEPDEKAWYEKAYDKASQVGMGVKKAASKMFLDDAASQRRLNSGETLDIGKYYRKGRDDEKAHDDAPSALKHANKIHDAVKERSGKDSPSHPRHSDDMSDEEQKNGDHSFRGPEADAKAAADAKTKEANRTKLTTMEKVKKSFGNTEYKDWQ